MSLLSQKEFQNPDQSQIPFKVLLCMDLQQFVVLNGCNSSFDPKDNTCTKTNEFGDNAVHLNCGVCIQFKKI